MQTIIERHGFDPAYDADNGSRFLTGNGYMGVRGTICEAGAEQMAAVNLAGIHHQKGDSWEEPLNAPNPLYLHVEGASLPENSPQLTAYRLALDISCGLFTRESTFALEGGQLSLRQERFCCMDQVHLLAQRVTLCADHDCTVAVAYGADETVWDIHGPHYDSLTRVEKGGVFALTGETDTRQRVSTAIKATCTGGEFLHGGIRVIQVNLQAQHPWTLEIIAAIYTTNDCGKRDSICQKRRTCTSFLKTYVRVPVALAKNMCYTDRVR